MNIVIGQKTNEIKFYFLGNILCDHKSRDKKLKLELKWDNLKRDEVRTNTRAC